LTSANMVRQTILGPPFDWWWNNQELVFNASATPVTATSTVVSLSSGTVTVTAVNTFGVSDLILVSGLAGGGIPLNGLVIKVATASSTGFTASVSLSGSWSDTAGTFTKATTQDYTLSAPSFSHIEHASIYDSTISKWYELTVKNNISLAAEVGRPRFINPHVEDGNGNMTFRLLPAPDKVYPVNLHIQLSATELTSVNQTWTPIPDFMEYVYNWGFLTLMWLFSDDARFPYANQKFLAGLLGRAEGLSEEERNIFLNNWEALTMSDAAKKQQGIQARGI
jgi:hypothetical protein